VSTRRGQLVELARVITASPALLTREQQIFARLTDSLAQLIAEDTGEASGAVPSKCAAVDSSTAMDYHVTQCRELREAVVHVLRDRPVGWRVQPDRR
jgi:hypothetical protein